MASNEFGVGGTDSQSDTPSSQLEVLYEAVESKADDQILDGLGLGNYGEREQWQQVESFASGLFADSAFSGAIVSRTIHEAIVSLGEDGYRFYDTDRDREREYEGWTHLDESDRQALFADDRVTRREFLEERGREIWERLSDDQKADVLREKVGASTDWTPPHWRMMQARHEASRSKDARLQDNLFGTRNVEKFEGDLDEAKSWLGGGGT